MEDFVWGFFLGMSAAMTMIAFGSMIERGRN